MRRHAAFLPSVAAAAALAVACGGRSGGPAAPPNKKRPSTILANGTLVPLPTVGPAAGDLGAVALKIEIAPWQDWGDTAEVERAFTSVADERLTALGVRVVAEPARPALVIGYREEAGPKYQRAGTIVTSTLANLTVSLETGTPGATPYQRTIHVSLQRMELVPNADTPEKHLHDLVVGNSLRALYETWLPLGKQVAAGREVHRSPPLFSPQLSRIGKRYAYYSGAVSGKAPAGLQTFRMPFRKDTDTAVQAVSLSTFKARALFPKAHPLRPDNPARVLPHDADDASEDGLFWCGDDRLCRPCVERWDGTRRVPCSKQAYELDAPSRTPAPPAALPFFLNRTHAARFDAATWTFVPLTGAEWLISHHAGDVFANLGGNFSVKIWRAEGEQLRSHGKLAWRYSPPTDRKTCRWSGALKEGLAAVQGEEMIALIDLKTFDSPGNHPEDPEVDAVRPEEIVAGVVADRRTFDCVLRGAWDGVSFDVAAPPPKTSQQLVFLGDLLIAAGGGPGMTFVDVSKPAAPEILGSQDVGGVVRDLRAGGGFVMASVHADPTARDVLAEVRLYELQGRAAELARRVAPSAR